MIKKILFIIILIFSQLSFASDDAQKVFEDANNAYLSKKYDEALIGYQELIKNGYSGQEIDYNLGNIYFKKNQKGEALYHYLRANQITPRNHDVLANIGYVRKQLDIKSDTLESVLLMISLQEALLLSAIGIFAFLLLVFFGQLRRKKYRFAKFLILIITIPSGFIFYHKYEEEVLHRSAIVSHADVPALANYLETSEAVFRLPEGQKVVILDEQKFVTGKVWYRIEFNRQKGWVSSENLGVL